MGYDDPRFRSLKKLKGKYKGKRLFITCTGPSLTIEDLENLKEEYVFGMNSIVLIHDKTDWKPDFFGIQDSNVYDRIKEKLWSTDNGLVFMPYGYHKRSEVPNNVVFFHMCGSYHLFEYRYKTREFAKYSENPYVRVYDGYSISNSIMLLAIYMGFDENYLLGADCTYLKDKQHFIEHGNVELQLGVADRMIVAYREVKKYADKNNIKIFNATRGGCLEVFPRVNIDEILKEPSNKKKI